MALRALLLIALLLPGCAPSPPGQMDQGQQQGLLEALQKLRLLNLAKGQHHKRRDTREQAQQQQSQQVVVDLANASQSAAVFPDLDSLLRNRLKRDQSLMVQINVFNSAGKGCWHKVKASSPALPAIPVGSTVVSAAPPEAPTPSSLQSARTPAPQLDLTTSTAYVALVTDYVPFINPKAPSVEYPIGWVSPGEVIGANATANIVVETTLARAFETDSAPLLAQGEKDIIHNYTATPSEFASLLQYSVSNVTWDDSLFTATNETSSNDTTDTTWKLTNPVNFFPKQNFDDYRSKNKSKRPFAPFGLPPPVLKVTIPLLIPPDEVPDDTSQPRPDVGMDFPKQPGTYDLNDASRCLQLLKLGLKCDSSTQVYRNKASGSPESPVNFLSGNIMAAVEPSNVGRRNSGTVERCVCSDSDLGDSSEGFKLSGTQELLLQPRAETLERLRPQQRPPLKVLGSLRYPPPTDIVYEYATTYVYDDFIPTALDDGEPQKAAPPQKLAQEPSYQQSQPVFQRSLGSMARPEATRYEPRAATAGPFAFEHKARRLKARNGARITSGPRKRFARDLRAVQEPAMWCPCSSTRKPPCTKTRKKCVKKKHTCRKKANSKKPCPKKIQEPNVLAYPVEV
ncbi:uncharacterized protein LOC142790159 [Rhipicephalus microplus]|uniref:uncharacterized protein LOC142790159 n=1 Tax=Rhipicephalus microplus TaxID=6941 RepID=UPI0023769073